MQKIEIIHGMEVLRNSMLITGFSVLFVTKPHAKLIDILMRWLVCYFYICAVVQKGEICYLVTISVILNAELCKIVFGKDVVLIKRILCST